MAPTDATSAARLAPVQRETLQDQVYQRLRGALLSAALAPGEVVTIRALARTLGTSAMPVREALKRLVAERVLEMLPNRSLRVPPMTVDRMLELYEIRLPLEGLATERATPRLEAHDLGTLERIRAGIVEAIARREVESYLTGHYRFYFTIYEAYSPVLVSIIEGLWLRAAPFFRLYFEESGRIEHAPAHFARVVEALRARDARAARKLVERNIAEASRYFASCGKLG